MAVLLKICPNYISQPATPKISQGRDKRFSDKELNETEIVHPGNGDKKILAKYLLRIAYHEAVHAGQFLSYLRAMNIERPKIWD